MFLPFPEGSLRFPRKRILFWTVAGAVVLSALFPPIVRAVETEMAGDLLILLAASVTLAAAGWLVREPAVKKILDLIVALFYAMSQFWLVNAAQALLPEERYLSRVAYGPYAPVSTLLYAVSAAVTPPAEVAGRPVLPMGKMRMGLFVICQGVPSKRRKDTESRPM